MTAKRAQRLFLTRRPLSRQGRPTGIWITGSASSVPEAGFIRPPLWLSGLSTWKCQFSYNHWSQATLSLVSVWMGDYLIIAWVINRGSAGWNKKDTNVNIFVFSFAFHMVLYYILNNDWVGRIMVYYSGLNLNGPHINTHPWGRSGLSTWKYQFLYYYWGQAK